MIIQEKGQYRDEVYAMWQRNFHDPVPYADFYFSEVYGKNEILLNVTGEPETSSLPEAPAPEPIGEEGQLEENGATEGGDALRGMLHLNPYQLLVCGNVMDAHYIVGVATEEEYRRQGVMRALLIETFARLRQRGEAFTYLMPADENYYLPFDFRFGMSQMEQEIEEMNRMVEPEKNTFAFAGGLPDNLEEVCRIENAARAERFAICTRITPDYLRRLVREVRSDFGRLISVYEDGAYVGRFIMAAENDYMVLSQIVCVREALSRTFLQEALLYCEKEYHYGKYQLILDETWREKLLSPGNNQGVRLLPAREKKSIMFRILDLEKLAAYLHSDVAGTCRIHVQDAYLKEQEGDYLCKVNAAEVCLSRIANESDIHSNIPDGGSITIAALTTLIFAKKEERSETLYEGLTPEGRRLLEGLCPLSPNCVQEIV